jgi:hypothetical protein
MSRKMKLSSCSRGNYEDPEMRKEWKQELKEARRLNQSREDRSADEAREAAFASSERACWFAKKRRLTRPPRKDEAGLRRLRHQLRPREARWKTTEARVTSKPRPAAEQGIHVLPPVLRIHDILGWIRIRILGSMTLTNGSGFGSGFGSGSGSWIRILLFSSLTFKMPAKN